MHPTVDQAVLALVETGLAVCAVFFFLLGVGSLVGRHLRSMSAAPAGLPDEDDEQEQYLKGYTHANILEDGPNRSVRRVNYSTIFCAALLALSLLGWAWGAGWFDRFLPH